MPKSATPEEINIIFEYIRKLMPDLELRIDRISVDDILYEGIFISTKIDRETSLILTGLVYLKANSLGLVDPNGSMNINMVATRINNNKNIVLYFT